MADTELIDSETARLLAKYGEDYDWQNAYWDRFIRPLINRFSHSGLSVTVSWKDDLTNQGYCRLWVEAMLRRPRL